MDYGTSSVVMTMFALHVFKYVFFVALLLLPVYILLKVFFPKL